MTTWRGAGRARGSADPVRARAERLHVRAWRDPRLLLGIVLVLGATVLGARAVSAADDTAPYWSLARDVRTGDQVSRSDLVQVRARLSGPAARRYLAVDDELPAGLEDLQWRHDRAAGSLLSADDVNERTAGTARHLPLRVADGAIPPGLRGGDRVEVWVGSGPGDEADGPATRVLEQVRVLRAGPGDGALDAGTRSVLVEVPADDLDGAVVAAVSSGHVTLVVVPD